MLRNTSDLLTDNLRYSERCRRFASGKAYLAYANDDMLRYATERCIGAVGEALSQALKQDPMILVAVPDARKIIALRHRLVHNYYNIYDAVIWSLVQQQLEPLELEVRALLQDVEDEGKVDE